MKNAALRNAVMLTTAAVVTACGNPPRNTRPLTAEEAAIVAEALELADLYQPVVDSLVLSADPLFSVDGDYYDNAQDNTELVAGMQDNKNVVADMFASDRVRAFDPTEMNGAKTHAGGFYDANAVVHSINSNTENDYIALSQDVMTKPDAVLPILLHESAHYYMKHSGELVDYLADQHSTEDAVPSSDPAFAQVVYDGADFPYLVSQLYDVTSYIYGFVDPEVNLQLVTNHLYSELDYGRMTTAEVYKTLQEYAATPYADTAQFQQNFEVYFQAAAENTGVEYTTEFNPLEPYGIEKSEIMQSFADWTEMNEQYAELIEQYIAAFEAEYPEFAQERSEPTTEARVMKPSNRRMR